MTDRRSLIAAALASALPLGACGRSDTLDLGVLRLATAAPMFVAEALGYYKQAGLKTNLRFFDAATQLPVAVTGGSVAIGATSLSAAFFNLAAKGGLRLIASAGNPHPGYRNNQLVASNAGHRAGLTSFASMKGRRLGITTIGSSLQYQIHLIAKKYGYSIADVRLVPLQDLHNLSSALEGGAIDGAVLPMTTAEPLIKRGAVKFVGWIADVATQQNSGVFTTVRQIKTDRERTVRFMRAHVRAMHFCHEAFNRRDAAGQLLDRAAYERLVAILQKHIKQPAAEIASGLGYFDPEARLIVDDLREAMTFWQQQGLVVANATIADVVDTSFTTSGTPA